MPFGSVIIIRRDGTDGTCFPLTTTTCWFGRKSECDIRVQLPQCSKQHCSIDINQDKEAVLTNFSTVNPTLLNGVQVFKQVTLKHGDILTIIDRSFRFEYPSEDHPHGKATRPPETKTVQEIRSRSGHSRDPDKTGDPRAQNEGEPRPPDGDGKRQSPVRELSPIDNRGPPVQGSAKKEAFSPFGKLYVSLKQEIEARARQRSDARRSPARGPGRDALTPASAPAKENRAARHRAVPPAPPKDGRSPSRRQSSASKENERDALSLPQGKATPEREGSRAAAPPKIVGILKRKSEAQSIDQPPDPSEGHPVEHRAKRSPGRHRACSPKSALPLNPRAAPAGPGEREISSVGREEEASSRRRRGRSRAGGADGPEEGEPGGSRPGSPASEGVGASDPPAPGEARQASEAGGPTPKARGASAERGGGGRPARGGAETRRSQRSSSGRSGPADQPAGHSQGESCSPKFENGTTASFPLPWTKRKRVSFGRQLEPELFDERLPPNSPLRKGATPTPLNTPVGISARALIRKYGIQALTAKRGSGRSPQLPDPCSPTPSPRRPAFRTGCRALLDPKWFKSPYLQPVARLPSPAQPKTPRSGGRNPGTTPRSGAGAGGSRPGTPRPHQRRSGRLLLHKASLQGGFGVPSYADIVRLGTRQVQKFMVRRRVLQRKVRRKPKATPKTPAKEVENLFSTGHANSPCTIRIGRAHLGKEPLKPVATVPKTEADQLTTDLMQPQTEVVESGPLRTSRIKDQRKSPKVLGRERRSRAFADSPYRLCLGKLRRVSLPKTLLLKTDEAQGKVASSPSSIRKKSKDLLKDNSHRKKSEKTVASIGSKVGAKSKQTPAKKLEPAEVLSAVKGLVRTPKIKAATVEDFTGIQRLMRTPKRKESPSEELREDLTGLKRLMKTPKEKSQSVEDLAGVQRLMRTPKEKAKPVEDLVGVKQLWKTPKEKAEPVKDLVGVKRLLRTPKEKSEPVDDLVGVSRLLRTPKEKSEPVDDLVGVSRLLKTPKEKSEPVDDLVGVSRLLRTPKEKSEPVDNLVGVSRLLRTPKEKSEPVEDLVGVSRLLRTPKEKSEPVDDLVGVSRLLRTPKEKSEPVDDLVGVSRLLRTPKEKSEPVDDLVGVSRLLRTPKEKSEPVDDLVGVKRLLRTPKQKAEPVEDFVGVKQLLRTPEPEGETMEDLGWLRTSKAKEDEPAEEEESGEHMDDLESCDRHPEEKAEPGKDLTGLEKTPRTPANETESRQPSDLPDSQTKKPTPGKPAPQGERNAKPRGRSGEDSAMAHSPQVTEEAGMQEDLTKKSVRQKQGEGIHPEEIPDKTPRSRTSLRLKSQSQIDKDARLPSSSEESVPEVHSPTSPEMQSAGDDTFGARLGQRKKISKRREDDASSEVLARPHIPGEECMETYVVTKINPRGQRTAERKDSGKKLISIDFVPEKTEILFNPESSVAEASSLLGRVHFQLEEPGSLPRGRSGNSEEGRRGVSPSSQQGCLSAEGKASPCFPSLTGKPCLRKSSGGREEILREKVDTSKVTASPSEGIPRSSGARRGPADAQEEISGGPTLTRSRMKSRLAERRGEEMAAAENATRKPLETRGRASRASKEEPGALKSVPSKSGPSRLISLRSVGDTQPLNRESAKPSSGPRAQPPSGYPIRAASAAGAEAKAAALLDGRRPATAGAETGMGGPVRIAPHPPVTPPPPEKPSIRLRRFGRKEAGVTGDNRPAEAGAAEAPAARADPAASQPSGSRWLRGKEPDSSEASAQEDYSSFFESSSDLPSSQETTEGPGPALPTVSHPPSGPAPSRTTRSRRLRGREPDSSETSPPEEYPGSFQSSGKRPSSRETTEGSGKSLPTAPHPPEVQAPSRATRSRGLKGKEVTFSEACPREEQLAVSETNSEQPSGQRTTAGLGSALLKAPRPPAGSPPSRTTRFRRLRVKEPDSSEPSPPEEYSSSFETSSDLPSSRESSQEAIEGSRNTLPTAPHPPSGPAPSRATRSMRLRGKEPDSSETSQPEEDSSSFESGSKRPSSLETAEGSGKALPTPGHPPKGPAPPRVTRLRRLTGKEPDSRGSSPHDERLGLPEANRKASSVPETATGARRLRGREADSERPSGREASKALEDAPQVAPHPPAGPAPRPATGSRRLKEKEPGLGEHSSREERRGLSGTRSERRSGCEAVKGSGKAPQAEPAPSRTTRSRRVPTREAEVTVGPPSRGKPGRSSPGDPGKDSAPEKSGAEAERATLPTTLPKLSGSQRAVRKAADSTAEPLPRAGNRDREGSAGAAGAKASGPEHLPLVAPSRLTRARLKTDTPDPHLDGGEDAAGRQSGRNKKESLDDRDRVPRMRTRQTREKSN
ncbi:proliferation marker protein Ki-67 [Tachyglossus aculeatus]|uniref:proliferation marker protein Ki-67 n=1 Tax=Tachyglossus aculeatus TaxID=9261 RepID=UPI0018F391A4|nr:proliferation marker protein Ki-67 [Tachyglossus aculeatus]